MLSKQNILTILIVILSFLLVAGGIFYYFDKKSTGEKTDKEKAELQSQIDDLKKQLDELKSTSTKSSTCASTLTSQDKLEIKTWKTYTNSKYGYSFQYPDPTHWKIVTQKDDIVTLEDKEDGISFSFRSGVMTALGFEGYKSDSKQDIKVACEKATKTSLIGDVSVDPASKDSRIIFVQFKKNSIDHMVDISYTYSGASISGDIVEAFDLILKTIEFK